MDFDVQSSKAQSANWIPTLVTRMSGNGTWDGMEGRQHRFLLLSLSDGQIRSNVKMPLRWSFCTRPISNGLQMTEISREEFQRDLKSESVDLQFPTSWFWPFLGRVGWGVLPQWPEFDETPADELRWNLWPLDDNCCPFVLWFFQILNRNLQGCFTDKRITQTC